MRKSKQQRPLELEPPTLVLEDVGTYWAILGSLKRARSSGWAQ